MIGRFTCLYTLQYSNIPRWEWETDNVILGNCSIYYAVIPQCPPSPNVITTRFIILLIIYLEVAYMIVNYLRSSWQRYYSWMNIIIALIVTFRIHTKVTRNCAAANVFFYNGTKWVPYSNSCFSVKRKWRNFVIVVGSLRIIVELSINIGRGRNLCLEIVSHYFRLNCLLIITLKHAGLWYCSLAIVLHWLRRQNRVE